MTELKALSRGHGVWEMGILMDGNVDGSLIGLYCKEILIIAMDR